MNYLWWAVIIGGLLALWWVFQSKRSTAPLNASGYTYPSSPGA